MAPGVKWDHIISPEESESIVGQLSAYPQVKVNDRYVDIPSWTTILGAAKVVSVDPKTDVAVIRLQGPLPANLPTVQLGDSDALRVGELVMAIGAPFGLTQTVTSGIISARGRQSKEERDREIECDARRNTAQHGKHRRRPGEHRAHPRGLLLRPIPLPARPGADP